MGNKFLGFMTVVALASTIAGYGQHRGCWGNSGRSYASSRPTIVSQMMPSAQEECYAECTSPAMREEISDSVAIEFASNDLIAPNYEDKVVGDALDACVDSCYEL